VTSTTAPLTLWDARQTLLGKLDVLGARDEVRSFVRRDAYSVAPELAVNGGRSAAKYMLGVLVFLEEHGASAEDLELAAGYLVALMQCAQRLGLDRGLVKLRESAREERIIRIEQGWPVERLGYHPFRVVGPDGKDCSYVRAARRRQSDGPDRHYLRDYCWVFKLGDMDGVLSLPCVACKERRASEPCAPDCSIAGGLCSGLWFKAIAPEVLGPFWPVFQRSYRATRQKIDTDWGWDGAKHGKEGPTGKLGGAPKKHDPDVVYRVLDLITRLGEDRTLDMLEDEGYPDWERRQLIHEADKRRRPH